MEVGVELAFLGKFRHGLLLENGGVVFEIPEDLRLEDHVAAVHQRRIIFILFAEVFHQAIRRQLQHTLHLGNVDRGDRGNVAVLLVELQKLRDVDVRNTVAVGQEERLAVQIFFDTFHASAGHGVVTGVHDGHAPGIGVRG